MLQLLSNFNEVYGSQVNSAVSEAPLAFPLQQKVLVCDLLIIHKHARSEDITVAKVRRKFLL